MNYTLEIRPAKNGVILTVNILDEDQELEYVFTTPGRALRVVKDILEKGIFPET